MNKKVFFARNAADNFLWLSGIISRQDQPAHENETDFPTNSQIN